MADGILGRFSRGVNTLFGGQFDPRLSIEDNKSASRDALVTGGLATLAAGGTSDARGFSPTGLQRVAAGALAGREQGITSREELRNRDMQAQIQELVDSGDATPEILMDMFMQSIANGDTDSARALAEVLKSMNASGSMRTTIRSQFDPKSGKNMDILFDFNTGEEIRVLGVSAINGTTRPRETLLDDQGRKVRYWLNPDGTLERIGFVSMGEGGQRGEEQERLMIQMRIANEGLIGKDHLMASIPAQAAAIGNKFTKFGANWWFAEGNPGQSPETQEAIVDALAFVNSGVRFFSGQQMTTQEFERYWTSWIPQPGEGQAGIAAKARKRAIIADGDASGRWEQLERENPNMTREEFRELIDNEAADAGLITDSNAASVDFLLTGTGGPPA